MPLPIERLRALVFAQLTEAERASCVVYLATAQVARGVTLSFPRATLSCPWDGYLAFVDLDPMANWSHACCYVCLEPVAGESLRVDAHLPPAGPSRALHHWQVIHRAPHVPPALLMVPEQ